MSMSIDLTFDGPVARVVFRGEKGVQIFSAAARERLLEVIGELEISASCRVVVFEAQGRTFIAGADINELQQLDDASGLEIARTGQQMLQRIANLNAVTIAAIHAACAGGGCELSLACDLRLAAASAAIGLPEVKLGLIPGWGGTVRAVRLFGPAVARRMIFTGELIAAAEAARLGIVDEAIADEQFREAVDRRVEQLLAAGPEALSAAKRLIGRLQGSEIAAQLADEAEVFARCCGNPESNEGTAAFLEKRPPRWTI